MENIIKSGNSVKQNPFILENGEYFPYLTFKEFIKSCEQDRLDEIQFLKNAWDKLKGGFKSAFGSWDQKQEPEQQQPAQGAQKPTDPFAAQSISTTDISKINLEAPPKDANPDAVTEKYQGLWEKLKSFAVKMKDVILSASRMTGISAPLAIAIIFAGWYGGMAAIPAAVILYFTRKILMTPILGFAGKVYDTAVDTARNVIRGPKVQKESFSLINEWTFTNDFRNYSLYKFLKNEGDINVSYKEWLANPNYELLTEGRVSDYLLNLIGRGAGHVAGFVSSAVKKTAKFLYNGIASALQWVWKWKVPIGKFLFLMAIGVLVGGTITKLTSPIVNDAVASVKTAIGMGAKVPPAQVAELNQIAKSYGGQAPSTPEDVAADPNAGMPPENWANPDSTDAVGVAQRAVDAKQALAQGKDIVDNLVTKWGIIKQRLVDVMRDMQNPDKDAVAVMNAAQTKAEFSAAYEKASSLGSSYFRRFTDALERFSQKTGKPIPDIDVSSMAPDDSAIDQFGNIVQSKAEAGSILDSIKNTALYKDVEASLSNAKNIINAKISQIQMKDVDKSLEIIHGHQNALLFKHNMLKFLQDKLNDTEKFTYAQNSFVPEYIKEKGVGGALSDFLQSQGYDLDKIPQEEIVKYAKDFKALLGDIKETGYLPDKDTYDKLFELLHNSENRLMAKKFALEKAIEAGKVTDTSANVLQSKADAGQAASGAGASDVDPSMMAPDDAAVDQFGNVIQSKAEVKSLIDTVKNSDLYKNAESLLRQKLGSASMKDIDASMANIDNYNNIILNKHNMFSYIEKTLNKTGLNLRSWLPDVIKNKGVDESFADFLKDTGTEVKFDSPEYQTLKTYWNEVLEKVGREGIAGPKSNLEKIGELFSKQADRLRDRKFELEQFMRGGKR